MADAFVKYLAIHVGHTRVKIGLFEVDKLSTEFNCLNTFSIELEEEWSPVDDIAG